MLAILIVAGAFALLALYASRKPGSSEPLKGVNTASAFVQRESGIAQEQVDQGNVEKGERLIGTISGTPVAKTSVDFKWVDRWDSTIYALCSSRFRLVPPALAKAIMFQESSFNPNALRGEPQINDESVGLMQLLTETARWVVPYRGLTKEQIRAKLLEPETNISAGLKYLTYQIGRYGNPLTSTTSFRKVIAAYNAGSAIQSKTDPTKFINEAYVFAVTSHYNRFITHFPAV